MPPEFTRWRATLLAISALVPLVPALWAEDRGTGVAWAYGLAALCLPLVLVLARWAGVAVAAGGRWPATTVAATALLACWLGLTRSWAELPGLAVDEAARWGGITCAAVAAYVAARGSIAGRQIVAWSTAAVLVILAANVGIDAIKDGLPAVRAAGSLGDAQSSAVVGAIAMLAAAMLAGSPAALARALSGPVAVVAGLAIASSGDAEAFGIGVLAIVVAMWARTRRLQDALAFTLAIAGTLLAASIVPEHGWIAAALLTGALITAALLGPYAMARSTAASDDAAARAKERRGKGISRAAVAGLVVVLGVSIAYAVVTRSDVARPTHTRRDRVDTWSDALDSFTSAPLVGQGGGGFVDDASEQFTNASEAADPGSSLLRLGVDGGLVAAMLGLLALVSLGIGSVHARRSINGNAEWRAAAVARGIAAALVAQALFGRIGLEPVLMIALGLAAGTALAAGTDEVSRAPGWRRSMVRIVVCLAAVLAVVPLASLALRERARSGDRSAARLALDLRPGAASVRAFGVAYGGRHAGADALEPYVHGSLANDPEALVVVAELGDRWNADELESRAQRRLHELDHAG